MTMLVICTRMASGVATQFEAAPDYVPRIANIQVDVQLCYKLPQMDSIQTMSHSIINRGNNATASLSLYSNCCTTSI